MEVPGEEGQGVPESQDPPAADETGIEKGTERWSHPYNALSFIPNLSREKILQKLSKALFLSTRHFWCLGIVPCVVEKSLHVASKRRNERREEGMKIFFM